MKNIEKMISQIEVEFKEFKTKSETEWLAWLIIEKIKEIAQEQIDRLEV